MARRRQTNFRATIRFPEKRIAANIAMLPGLLRRGD
jgi:hypothetical protein